MRYDLRGYNAQRTQEERKELASKAGKASAEARRARKPLRQAISDYLNAPVTDKDALAALREAGLDVRQQDLMILAAVRKAQTGDIEAMRFVRDTIGEKPTEAYTLSVADKPVEAIDLSSLTDDELAALADRETAKMESGCSLVALPPSD